MTTNKPIHFRECPGCGHTITMAQLVQMRYDVTCPHCEQYKFSAYVPSAYGLGADAQAVRLVENDKDTE